MLGADIWHRSRPTELQVWLSPIPVLMSSAPTKGAPCFSLHVPDHFILVLVNSSNQIFFPHSVTIS